MRAGETVAITYFVYTAVLASLHRLSWPLIFTAWLIPAGIWILAAIETRYSRRWSGIARNWIPLALILAAYRQLNWFAAPVNTRWSNLWMGLDRLLFDHLGFRAAVESFGGFLPATLEAFYLLLYAIPPLCMAAIYLNGERHHADRFLFTLLLGTFTAYALVPYFPTDPPRFAFPGEDLPHYAGLWRSWNLRLLARYDVSTAVFPSGHIAVAFSCGFGVMRAMPSKRWWWGATFTTASMVFIATVYGRYHYAADGIASLGISTAAWLASEVIDRDA